MNDNTFVVLAKDRRYELVASLFAEDGKKIYTWCSSGVDGIHDVPTLMSLFSPIMLILPFNLSPEEQLYAIKCCPDGSHIFGGEKCVLASGIMREKGLTWHNLLSERTYVTENAIPTAEGALMEVIGRTETTVNDSAVLVLGWGFVAKAVARLFSAVGADVTVAARRPEARVDAASEGFRVTEFPIERLEGYDTVINTVPAKDIIPHETLRTADEEVLIIDLASGKMNISTTSCDELGIRFARLPALPSRVAPLTAAKSIKDAVMRLLSSERIHL